MITDPTRLWDVIAGAWMHLLLGTGLLVFGCCAGWAISRARALAPVRFVTWWVQCVLFPRLRHRSWFVRATLIYVNNILILTVLMLVSPIFSAVIVVTAVVGTSIGIVMRALAEDQEWGLSSAPRPEPTNVRLRSLGLCLNLLEPLAIALTLGLALGRVPRGLTGAEVWSVFAIVIAPLMLAAACGESLWMGLTPGFTDRLASASPSDDGADSGQESPDRDGG